MGSPTPHRAADRTTVSYSELQADDYVTFRTPKHRFRSGRAISRAGDTVLVRAYSKEHETVAVTEAMFQYGNRRKTPRVNAPAA
jgi:hypothetical protein